MTGGGRRILGIDPGSRLTGYGIVDCRGRELHYLASGCIRTPDGAFPERLAAIYHGVSELIARYQVTEFAVEEVFLARNPLPKDMVAQAIPSVSPSRAAEYFHKTECFCFNQQPLEGRWSAAAAPPKRRSRTWSACCWSCPACRARTPRTRLRLPSATSILPR